MLPFLCGKNTAQEQALCREVQEAVESGRVTAELKEKLGLPGNDRVAVGLLRTWAQDGTIARLIGDVQAGQVRGEMERRGDESWKMSRQKGENRVIEFENAQPISQKDFQGFEQKVKELGIQQEGFETYQGDIRILNEIIEGIAAVKRDFPTLENIKNGLKVQYQDLGNGDDFAMVRGKTIIFNKALFDDPEMLQQAYMEGIETGLFVQGTDCRSIPYHEAGHLLTKADPKLAVTIERIVWQRAQELGMKIEDYIGKNISDYATIIDPFSRGCHQELLPELLSLWYNQPNKTEEQTMLLNKLWEGFKS